MGLDKTVEEQQKNEIELWKQISNLKKEQEVLKQQLNQKINAEEILSEEVREKTKTLCSLSSQVLRQERKHRRLIESFVQITEEFSICRNALNHIKENSQNKIQILNEDFMKSIQLVKKLNDDRKQYQNK